MCWMANLAEKSPPAGYAAAAPTGAAASSRSHRPTAYTATSIPSRRPGRDLLNARKPHLCHFPGGARLPQDSRAALFQAARANATPSGRFPAPAAPQTLTALLSDTNGSTLAPELRTCGIIYAHLNANTVTPRLPRKCPSQIDSAANENCGPEGPREAPVGKKAPAQDCPVTVIDGGVISPLSKC